jgi:hypothetical protein
MKKYGIILNGRMVRLCASLALAMASQVYKPWDSSCHVYEFSYDVAGKPVDATLVK